MWPGKHAQVLVGGWWLSPRGVGLLWLLWVLRFLTSRFLAPAASTTPRSCLDHRLPVQHGASPCLSLARPRARVVTRRCGRSTLQTVALTVNNLNHDADAEYGAARSTVPPPFLPCAHLCVPVSTGVRLQVRVVSATGCRVRAGCAGHRAASTGRRGGERWRRQRQWRGRRAQRVWRRG